jgi:hypothetical protein
VCGAPENRLFVREGWMSMTTVHQARLVTRAVDACMRTVKENDPISHVGKFVYSSEPKRVGASLCSAGVRKGANEKKNHLPLFNIATRQHL